MKRRLFTIMGASALGLALAGCPTDGPTSPGNGPTTGIKTITETDITLSGDTETMPQTIAETMGDHGETFSITGKKLSFTLPELPTNTENNLTINSTIGPLNGPSGAQFAVVKGFTYSNGQGSVSVSRKAESTLEENQIVYVYTSKDVTLSRAAKTEEKSGITFQWDAIRLALRKGWNLVQNLVQINSQLINNSPKVAKVTVKIAVNTDVPWNVKVSGNV